MPMPSYMADNLLNWIKHTSFPAAPANLYLALCTTSPSFTAAGTEVTASGYARATVAAAVWSVIGLADDGSHKISNGSDIVFAAVAADAGNIVGWELRDASSSGNRVDFGDFNTTQFLASGKVFKVLAGALVINPR